MNIETTGRAVLPPIRLGIAGLGLAGSFMIRAAVAHPRIALCAGMDPLSHPREAFGIRIFMNYAATRLLKRSTSRRPIVFTRAKRLKRWKRVSTFWSRSHWL